MVAHLKISFMSMRKAGGSSSHTLTKYKRVKHNVHKFPMASILCANKQKLAPRGKFEVSQIERSCVEKEKGFREGCEGGWARRHGMVWAEHPGRRPLAVIPIKLWLVSRPAVVALLFIFSLFCHNVSSALSTFGKLPVRVIVKYLSLFKYINLGYKRLLHLLRMISIPSGSGHCNWTLFGFSIKFPVSKIFTKSVAVLYGGEGWEGRVLGEELQQGETIKRVPRMWLRRAAEDEDDETWDITGSH